MVFLQSVAALEKVKEKMTVKMMVRMMVKTMEKMMVALAIFQMMEKTMVKMMVVQEIHHQHPPAVTAMSSIHNLQNSKPFTMNSKHITNQCTTSMTLSLSSGRRESTKLNKLLVTTLLTLLYCNLHMKTFLKEAQATLLTMS